MLYLKYNYSVDLGKSNRILYFDRSLVTYLQEYERRVDADLYKFLIIFLSKIMHQIIHQLNIDLVTILSIKV